MMPMLTSFLMSSLMDPSLRDRSGVTRMVASLRRNEDVVQCAVGPSSVVAEETRSVVR